MSKIIIHNHYNPAPQISKKFDPDLGRTKQAFKDECDINNIIKRYTLPTILDSFEAIDHQFGDTTGIDYQDYQLKVAAGKTAFEELPAKIRLEFANDPAKFLDFVHDPENADRLVELGIASKIRVDEYFESMREKTPAEAEPIAKKPEEIKEKNKENTEETSD